jgi:hypothetical protein
MSEFLSDILQSLKITLSKVIIILLPIKIANNLSHKQKFRIINKAPLIKTDEILDEVKDSANLPRTNLVITFMI